MNIRRLVVEDEGLDVIHVLIRSTRVPLKIMHRIDKEVFVGASVREIATCVAGQACEAVDPDTPGAQLFFIYS